MNKITVLHVDVWNNTARKIEITPSLDTYYKLLNCDCIDIATRRIAGKLFDIICDDEALLRSNPRVSCVDGKLYPMLCGSLLFCHHDDEGNTTVITDAEAAFILKRVHHLTDIETGAEWPVVTRCEY